LLFDENLEVLVDDGHCQQDARSGADGADEVGHDRQGPDAETPESGSGWDVPAENGEALL